ncbi:hypothetical protein CYMTET_17191 [Cymbomonas tetramitiformis]|uniref:Integrase zinc-binding domain-containing protein n=1 Tax=Cymbomonas tetramitiformis TaxID=36881 RepID=A0AAE0L773_9CHLO|nr:hypothetical protein CYMTET_17191 [Cymbomonas tetramitiformis]
MKCDVTAGMLFQKAGGELTRAVATATQNSETPGGIADISEYRKVVGLLSGLARGVLDRNTAVGFGVCEMVYQRWLRQERDGGNYEVAEKQLAAVVEGMQLKYRAAALTPVAALDLSGNFGNLYLMLKHKDVSLWGKRRPVVPGFAAPDRLLQNRIGTVVRRDDIEEKGETREVNLDEKAIAMGYSASELRMARGMRDEELAGILGLAMDRRAMELLYAVAEVSATKLPKSQESEEEEHGALAAIPIVGSAKVTTASELAPGPVQAQLAEWVTRFSDYTQQVARRLSHQDWEERLQHMCSQGQKGTQGLGTAAAVLRRRQWKLASMELAGYKARHRQAFSRPGDKPVEVNSAPEWAPVAKEKEMRLSRLPDTTRLVAMVASVTQQESLREEYPDIHEDELCLAWIKTGGSGGIPKEEYHRVRKRAARHRWDELMGELYMVTISGKELLVPKPGDRIQLVREYHERTGHWGIRRTLNLLWQRHYWVGMKQDVRAVITQCETCQRVKTHHAREEAMLTPLEIKSFMYHWSLDLAWPTKRVTKAGNQPGEKSCRD